MQWTVEILRADHGIIADKVIGAVVAKESGRELVLGLHKIN